MIDFSEVEKYLPKHLSKNASESLFAELSSFPENIDKRLYSTYLSQNNLIYQGDGLKGMLSINLPDTHLGEVPGLVLSNTCDIDEENERLMEPRVVFAVIFKLEKYKNLLVKKFVKTGLKSESSINDHIDQIKKQYISHIFYLPAGENLEHDSIAFFDRVNNISNSFLERDKIQEKRLFTLSDYGFYFFLYKLSIHYTRIRENVQRIDL